MARKAIPAMASVVQIWSTGWLAAVSPKGMGPSRRFVSRSPDDTRSALALIRVQTSLMSIIERQSLPRRFPRTLRNHGDREGHRVAQGEITVTIRGGIDLKPVLTGRHGSRKCDLRLIACSSVSGRDNFESGIESPRRYAAQPVGDAADPEIQTSRSSCRECLGGAGEADPDRACPAKGSGVID